MLLFGHDVRGILAAGYVAVVNLAGCDEVTEVVQTNIERFAVPLHVFVAGHEYVYNSLDHSEYQIIVCRISALCAGDSGD